MIAVVIALVVQGVWQVAFTVLEQCGLGRDPYTYAFAFAVAIATDVVIAAAAIDATRRLAGRRKLGMAIVAVAYLVIAASTTAREVIVYRGGHDPTARAWLMAMYHYGWTALDLIAIAGFGIASGRRGAWLAPLAGALAVARSQPYDFVRPGPQLGLAVLVVVNLALLALMALEAERHATRRDPDRARVTAALCRLELIAWLWAGTSVIHGVLHAAHVSSPWISLAFACVDVVAGVIVVRALSSVGRAAIPALPAWPWFLAAIGALWTLARVVRLWFLVLTKWGSALGDAPLGIAHWSVTVPDLIGTAAAFAALALFARRAGARELARATLFAGVFVGFAFAAQIAFSDERVVVSAFYIVLNIASARVYRTARTVVDGVPTARVV